MFHATSFINHTFHSENELEHTDPDSTPLEISPVIGVSVHYSYAFKLYALSCFVFQYISFVFHFSRFYNKEISFSTSSKLSSCLLTLCIFSFLTCLFSEQFLFCLYVNSPSVPLPCSIIQMMLYIRQVLYITELLAQDILPLSKFEVST